MNDIAIEIKNLSKQYRLGIVGTGTLSHDLKRWWTVNIRRKDDPYTKIGEVNDHSTKGNSDYVWALKNLELTVKKGEVLGIIGKNGAGKSTLLKILSKVTKPTIGTIKYRGRICSLLEVGTGFHPEMTGKENVFMNGSIMGMSKKEIEEKLDDILDFAGVNRYADTPVKRYSSGMIVRLGFSIAAHLEPDILIVDEVLAVGDAEFQKKAIGKMKDVSQKHGRTVLFVSHNMQAVNVLCDRAILMDKGTIIENGLTHNIIRKYNEINESTDTQWTGDQGDQDVRLLQTKVFSKEETFYADTPITIEIKYKVINTVSNLVVGFHLLSEFGGEIAYTIKGDYTKNNSPLTEPGIYNEQFIIPPNMLTKGNYFIRIDLGLHDVKFICKGFGDLKFFLLNRNNVGCKYPVQDVKGYSSLFRPNWHNKTITL